VTSDSISAADLMRLARAKRRLENPSVAIRIANAVGAPIEKLTGRLPAAAQKTVSDAVNAALMRALELALKTLDSEKQPASKWAHRIAVGLTGAAGGAFGLAALAVELPVSTTLMLRSIADEARAQGEDLATREARLECLAVFALGGESKADDAAESAYFAARLALAEAMREAASHLARGAAAHAAPPLARLVTAIAARFGIAVEEKALAQLLPVIGAIGGATVNTVFIQHFQDMAEGHFTVRALERVYGAEAVKVAYLALPSR
jgi:hypothetical protein